MKTIRSKMITMTLGILAVNTLVLGSVSAIMSQRSALDALDKSMRKTAEIAAERVHEELLSYQNIAVETGTLTRMTSGGISLEEKREIIDQKVSQYQFERGSVIGKDGIDIFDGTDVSGEDYFAKGMAGESFVTDPILDSASGGLDVLLGAPIWKDGKPGTSVEGVIYYVPDEEFLSSIVKSINIGDTGSSYLLNSAGTVIAHKDSSLIMKSNTIEEAKSDKALKTLADMESQALAGNNGFGKYQWDGVNKIQAYSPVPGSSGWALCITAEQSEFMTGARNAVIITAVLAVVFMVAGGVLGICFGNVVGGAITLCAKRLRLLVSEGDLNSDVPTVKANDETGDLLQDLGETIERLRKVVRVTSMHLEAIAAGDLTGKVENQFSGDFGPITQSLVTIYKSLNETMHQIDESAVQVSSGSNQVSDGAQALSQGATEQASSVEELAASMGEIASQIHNNAQNAEKTSEKADSVGSMMEVSSQQMQHMMEAMREISQRSDQIGKIIKDIEDIAFQTNILALNAAVEAARAGDAGKGFAVVADEVRNLASKSSESSKNTAVLIESTINAVENGIRIANETAESLTRAVSGVREVTENINKITLSSKEQAVSVTQINLGIDQIASVVQNNSATSEESAAASEELSGQAHILADLVKKFKVNE